MAATRPTVHQILGSVAPPQVPSAERWSAELRERLQTVGLFVMHEDDFRERLDQAWNEGFEQGDEAGEGRDWTPSPYRARVECGMEFCTDEALTGRKVCGTHFRTLTDLLAPVSS